MDELLLYLKIGYKHVLDFNNYDHILFLTVLAVVYRLKQWKRVVWLVTLFTLGHTLTLGLAVYGVIKFSVPWVEFLIPVTIIVTALSNIFTVKNATNSQNLFFALFFGLIHGVGFSNGFKSLVGRTQDKFLPLIEFALGVEVAQVVIVLAVVLLGAVALILLKRRDWIIIVSSMVLALALKMAYVRIPF